MGKVALITGVTGQDGSYLAELLLGKGYVVHGMVRRASTINTSRIDHLYQDPHDEDVRFHLHYGDMLDGAGLHRLVATVKPDEVYNLAAQSHVRTSFDQPVYTAEVVAIGTLNLLEAVRAFRDTAGHCVRFYQASSSEMFGSTPPPHNEESKFHPRSPYACAKVHAYYQVINHREAYGLFACNGILFNHESPRRGETFVTRKITRAATRIKLRLQDKLYLGNLDARRDWGFAGEYVQAMWQMLQQDAPDDFVIATGITASVEEFATLAFGMLDLDFNEHVVVDERYLRPSEVPTLLGDAAKAHDVLDWWATVYKAELCKMMVEADMKLAERELALKEAGLDIPESCPSV